MVNKSTSNDSVKLGLIVVLTVGLLILCQYLTKSQTVINEGLVNSVPENVNPPQPYQQIPQVKPQNNQPANIDVNVDKPKIETSGNAYPLDQIKPNELLPNDTSSLWASVNPAGQGQLKDKNFLQSGHHIGINTVGQTLRNANLQLRSEPPNPRVAVSPWLTSTIEPDTNRLHFEIGSTC
jgi:hypothetical protein